MEEPKLEVAQSEQGLEQSTLKAGQSTKDQQRKQKSELDHQVVERLAQMPSEALCWQAPSCSKSCPFFSWSSEAHLHRRLEDQ